MPESTNYSHVEHVRKRPGMYLGPLDSRGFSQLLWEVVGNSVDQFLAGNSREIHIELMNDGSISIEDDGPGFPIKEINGIPLVELACTAPHHTPTLDGHAPHEHITSFGLGIFIVNALSEWMRIDFHRDGCQYSIGFSKGVTTSPLTDVGKAKRTGTRVVFSPDLAVLPGFRVDMETFSARLQELSFLLPGLSLTLRDHRVQVFHHPLGLRAFAEKRPGHFGEMILPTFAVEDSINGIRVEVAASWWTGTSCTVESFANVHRTTEGGTHVRGLRKGLAKAMRKVAPEKCRGLNWRTIADRIGCGMHAIVQVRLADVRYAGPTRDQLITPAAEDAVCAVVTGPFADFIRNHPRLLDRMVE